MSLLERCWYSDCRFVRLLLPLSWLYRAIVAARRRAYDMGLFRIEKLNAPVIVVGNIVAGGTGKTPLVIWLIDFLRRAGYAPAIVSRGYGGSVQNGPHLVTKDSDPHEVGDEPVLLARRCDCPVTVDANRVRAARYAIDHGACDIIVADDGLQHYALGRDIEIAVIDGARRFGNGFCLPAGPLREPVRRLQEVDLIVVNGEAATGEFSMRLAAGNATKINDATVRHPLADFKGQTVHAVAGIGNPRRFFDFLRERGLNVIEHSYADHYPYTSGDIDFNDDLQVLMTEKDAVKCRPFARDRHWYVPVDAELEQDFGDRLMELLGDAVWKRSTEVK